MQILRWLQELESLYLRKKAREENLALVSLMAPPLHRFVERLLMPAFVFFFKLLYSFRLANKPGWRVAAAAGRCILVEIPALHRIGAFTSLHDVLIDDCILASHIKRTGLRTRTGLSHSACSHRGYDDIKTIWDIVAPTSLYTTTLLSFIAFCLHPDHGKYVLICSFGIITTTSQHNKHYHWHADVGCHDHCLHSNFTLLPVLLTLNTNITYYWYFISTNDRDLSTPFLAG
jgi:hypothetical protein